MTDQSVDDLLTAPLRVINVGLEGLAESLEALEVPVVGPQHGTDAGGRISLPMPAYRKAGASRRGLPRGGMAPTTTPT